MTPFFSTRTGRLISSFTLGAICILCFGCKLEVVSFPQSIELGETVEFVFRVENDEGNSAGQPYFTARIPAGWNLLSSTYEESTVGPESGILVPVTVEDNCGFTFGGSDYQTISLTTDPPIYSNYGDSAILRLEFQINALPSGPYRTWFATWAILASSCSEILVTNWNEDSNDDYRVGNSHPIENLGLRNSITAQKGKDNSETFVYVINHDRLLYYHQNGSGELGYSGEIDGSLHPEWGLESCSSIKGRSHTDTNSLYFGCESSTLYFEHDYFPTPNAPEFGQRVDLPAGSPGSIGINSPDGTLLYRGDHPNNLIYRVAENGPILESSEIPWSGNKLRISSDEKTAYAIQGDGIIVLDLQTEPPTVIQAISPADHSGVLEGSAFDMDLRPDGRYLYLSTINDDSLRIFSRDLATGLLIHEETVSNEDHPQSLGLFKPIQMDISEDGTSLLVVSQRSNSISRFAISPISGDLTLQKAMFFGDDGFSPLYGIRQAVFSPDANRIFVTTRDDLTGINRIDTIFNDGFESGDLGQWSSSSP